MCFALKAMQELLLAEINTELVVLGIFDAGIRFGNRVCLYFIYTLGDLLQ